MRPQTYKDPRPAEYFTQFHEAARKGVGWTYTFARIVLTLPTLLIYRVRAIGVSNFKPHHLEELLKGAKTVPTVNQIEHAFEKLEYLVVRGRQIFLQRLDLDWGEVPAQDS